jgi:UDP:flavonoid glycosyltransferase YjiC (YdhE family)
MSNKKKILFVANFVSFSHLGRPIALANSLDPELYDIYFAAPTNADQFIKNDGRFRKIQIATISQDLFVQRLKTGKPLFTFKDLRQSLIEDQGILDSIKPDVIIGDLRWPLSISAKKAGIHYLALTNAHLSPFSGLKLVLPYFHYLSRLSPDFLSRVFRVLRFLVFPLHCIPINLLKLLNRRFDFN